MMSRVQQIQERVMKFQRKINSVAEEVLFKMRYLLKNLEVKE